MGFGVSLLVAGIDEKEPCLYHTDPSGTFTRYQAKAIGAGSEGAENALKEHYHASMALHEAQTLALKILKQVMEEKLSGINVEMAVVLASDRKFSVIDKAELETMVENLDDTPL